MPTVAFSLRPLKGKKIYVNISDSDWKELRAVIAKNQILTNDLICVGGVMLRLGELVYAAVAGNEYVRYNLVFKEDITTEVSESTFEAIQAELKKGYGRNFLLTEKFVMSVHDFIIAHSNLAVKNIDY